MWEYDEEQDGKANGERGEDLPAALTRTRWACRRVSLGIGLMGGERSDGDGKRVEGTVEVAEKETIWRFQPKASWKPGTYRLVVDQELEDLAGNNVARPFEV